MCDNKTDRKFDAQTRNATDSQNYKTGTHRQKPDTDNVSGDKTNIPNYINSSTTKHMPDYSHSNDSKEAKKKE